MSCAASCRRAVRYGRTLGFHEPFFSKLVGVLVRSLGDVFPELREKQVTIEETLKREEESFNRTLDRGIELFEREAARLSGRVGVPPAGSGVSPEQTSEPTKGATYTRRRRLPHFEQPWALYALTISTANRRKLPPESRTIVLDALRHFDESRYTLIAACVMPDHIHALLQPWPKEQNEQGETVFWSLSELMHSLKSFTAKEINKAEGTTGPVWEQERFDRYVRGDRDLEEKFQYIVTNPEREGLGTDYPWVWTREDRSGRMPEPAGGTPTLPGSGESAAHVISGEFAFRLYDEQGFPLDLTELMARERGLTVDTAGFEKLMEEQRTRARAAQKKTTIELAEGSEADARTNFLGYEHDHTGADVEAVTPAKGKTAVILNNTVCYAEMGGQVGDTGELAAGEKRWRILDTRKAGHAWVHLVDNADALAPGAHVTVRYDATRRRAIERHHTVTHLLHWALHEIVSREAVQKGSYVGPEKLTFDFSSAPLSKDQVAAVEKRVNERIAENAPVSWTEIPYAEARKRERYPAIFRRQIRRKSPGGADRRQGGRIERLLDGTLRRHPCARHGRAGLVQDHW